MSDGIEREYGRRRGVPPAFLTTPAVAGLVTVGALDAMATLGPSGWEVPAVAAWLIVADRGALEQLRARTFVTADGVTVRGAIRTRGWAWSDIYGIRVEDNRGSTPHWSGYLYATDGRRIRLPHLDEYQLTDRSPRSPTCAPPPYGSGSRPWSRDRRGRSASPEGRDGARPRDGRAPRAWSSRPSCSPSPSGSSSPTGRRTRSCCSAASRCSASPSSSSSWTASVRVATAASPTQ